MKKLLFYITIALLILFSTVKYALGAEYYGAQDFTNATITMTTQAPGDNSTKGASTAYVDAAAGGGNVEDGTADGQMVFWDNTAGEYKHTEIAELMRDDTNNRLSIRNTTPLTALDIFNASGNTPALTQGMGNITQRIVNDTPWTFDNNIPVGLFIEVSPTNFYSLGIETVANPNALNVAHYSMEAENIAVTLNPGGSLPTTMRLPANLETYNVTGTGNDTVWISGTASDDGLYSINSYATTDVVLQTLLGGTPAFTADEAATVILLTPRMFVGDVPGAGLDQSVGILGGFTNVGNVLQVESSALATGDDVVRISARSATFTADLLEFDHSGVAGSNDVLGSFGRWYATNGGEGGFQQVTLIPRPSSINVTDGAMYYNSTSGKFQFYEDGAWIGLSQGLWQRTGTELSPLTSGDSVIADGGITIGDGTGSSGTITFHMFTNNGSISYDDSAERMRFYAGGTFTGPWLDIDRGNDLYSLGDYGSGGSGNDTYLLVDDSTANQFVKIGGSLIVDAYTFGSETGGMIQWDGNDLQGYTTEWLSLTDSPYWDRTGTLISPKTAGDYIGLDSDARLQWGNGACWIEAETVGSSEDMKFWCDNKKYLEISEQANSIIIGNGSGADYSLVFDGSGSDGGLAWFNAQNSVYVLGSNLGFNTNTAKVLWGPSDGSGSYVRADPSGPPKIIVLGANSVDLLTGDGTNNLVTIEDGIKFELGDSATQPPLFATERSVAPSAPATGDIYLDDGTSTASGNPAWRRYTGAAWEDLGGGATVTPGGADTQIQYNDGGVFGGIAEFTWDDTDFLMSGATKLNFRSSAIGISSDDGNHLDINTDAYIDMNGVVVMTDKVIFTQLDGHEYIDSFVDGNLDIGATNLIRLNSTVQIGAAYTLPPTDGNADQVITTDGAGASTWEDAGGVNGPVSSIVDNIATFADTSGELLKDSGVATTSNADGADISGGTVSRALTWTGADITLTGAGSNTHTFPSSSQTLVGRTSADTLTNKTFDDALTVNQIVTPSNPAATYNKLYAKSDDYLYILTSAGVESKVGSGDVVGPASAVDNNMPLFDGTTGKLIKDSGVTVTAAGSATITFPSSTSTLMSLGLAETVTGEKTFGTDTKLLLRDSAIGVYSQADTYLDLFADGAVRIGNSSAGAPTTYADITPGADLTFVGSGSGLPYGGISVVSNATETTISSSGVAVQVTIFDTNAPSNNTTPDHTNDHVTISKAGDYMIVASATVNSVAGLGSKFEMTVQKNNGASLVDHLHVDRNIDGGGGKAGSVSMSGIATLAASDTIEVWIENETNTANYVVEDITLSLFQLGG